MPRPTASSLWLAEKCPASHVLPQVRETSDVQAKGSAVHRYLELAPRVGKEAALAQLSEDFRELCSELDPAALPRGLREEPLCYDLAERRGWTIRIDRRDYPQIPGVACGTADVLSVHDQSVWDYKTGRPGRAADSLQLLALGLYAARTFDWMRVTVGHLRVDGERLRPDSVELGALDLAAAHERIARIYERYEQAKEQELPDVFPGEHCTNCAAAPACPATTAMVRRIAEALSEEERIAEMVAADPAGAWAFLGRAEDAMKRLRAELKRCAAVAPIPLPNGKQLAIVDVDKTRIDGKVGLPVLREALGDKTDEACSVNKASLKKLLGKAGLNVLMTRLAAAGAVEENTEHHLREVRAEDAA